jgi:hypothetical protein
MRARPMESADTATAAARRRSTETRTQCSKARERDVAEPISPQAFSDGPLNQPTTATTRQHAVPFIPRLLPYITLLATQRRTYEQPVQPTSLPSRKPFRSTSKA